MFDVAIAGGGPAGRWIAVPDSSKREALSAADG
jgi:hypothetical protein